MTDLHSFLRFALEVRGDLADLDENPAIGAMLDVLDLPFRDKAIKGAGADGQDFRRFGFAQERLRVKLFGQCWFSRYILCSYLLWSRGLYLGSVGTELSAGLIWRYEVLRGGRPGYVQLLIR